MGPLSQRLYTVAQIRELDKLAIASLHDDSYALMQRAATAAYRRLRARWPEVRRITVCCGHGNNGGDGYVIARLARADGLDADVIRCEPGASATTDSALARADFTAAGGVERRFEALESLEGAEVIVDAIFGIGLVRPPASPEAALIEAINASGAPVLAVDVPSGLDADTGMAPGACVRAALTVSFIGWKRGLFTGVAAGMCGQLLLETLELDRTIYSDVYTTTRLISPEAQRAALPPRNPSAHKGDFGHVLVVGGDRGFGGAARLAAEGALRCGAGLVSVATRAEHVAPLLAARPEIMAHAVEAGEDLDPLIERATVLVVGPGLGRDAWGRALLARVLKSAKPLMLDADALNLIAESPHELPLWCVISPHPREAARLLGVSTEDVQRDRFAAATRLAARFRTIAVLKGAGSIVADAEGRLDLCPIAEPALASGGTGDVLAGVIGGLMAQRLTPALAARVGVIAHARAGVAAGSRGGARGVIASDLLAELRVQVNP